LLLGIFLILFVQFTLAIALLALAYHFVSKQRIRLTLFNRRLAVFEGVQEVFTNFLVQNDIAPDDLRRFMSVTAEAPFILGPDIVNHLNEIRSRFIVLVVVGQVPDRANLPASERQKAELAERWLKDHVDNETLQNLFAKEMGLFSSARTLPSRIDLKQSSPAVRNFVNQPS